MLIIFSCMVFFFLLFLFLYPSVCCLFIYYLLPPWQEEVMFMIALICLSEAVCLSVCGQHYSKSYERVGIRVVKLLLCAYYYYYYYYFIYLNSVLLLLLLLHHIFKRPITITITVTGNVWGAYYYYYYFPDYYYYDCYYFPIILHLFSLLNQRNTTQADHKVIFKDLYYFHSITHYHRHFITDNIIIKLS